ncbi:hypothetical protein [Desulfoluna butyratoxydans]|uniref:Uncharacterized protein n=1 Tax=Desulfoluna butyratoxydans TaxID=231438 RepID=A0A4U8YXY2_9BACT|nr:hypothetical protein [Desulfoluna butyratoxydans]VFQ46942.1 hypothetical protein MSL71_46240 [Desulfoluna butyratoxydans]
MSTAEKRDETIQTMSENLAAFAVDREDLKLLLATLPEDDTIKTVTVEYELQILKIISAGWAVSVYMDGKKEKDALAERFWLIIREFSKTLSETLHLTTGADVDYFETLKQRFDTYLAAIKKAGKGEPTQAVGPEFARLCDCPDNPFVTLNGARIFHLTVTAVQEYVAAVTIVPEST